MERASDAPRARLIPLGPPLRLWSGLPITAAGLVLGFAVALSGTSARVGVPLGALAAAIATFGVLFTIGSLHDPPDAEAVSIRTLAPGLLTAFISAAGCYGTLRLAVAGYFGPVSAGILMPVTFLGFVAGAAMTLSALGVIDPSLPFYRRHGFWLLAIATGVLLPALGSYSLIDPWETHYGEVSREILARNDWISLWWAHEEWFWSKPVLGFWMQALAMAILGVQYEPGGMMDAARAGRVPWPEWAVRFPFFLVTIAATYLLYKAVARAFGKRAGLIGGVVLTTMPQWFFLSHQTMTDMPFVAGLAAALSLFLLGAHEPEGSRVRVFAVRLGRTPLSLSAHSLVVGAVCLVVIPQIVYLLSRNFAVNVDPEFGLRMPPLTIVHDRFASGSAGNCGVLPGNDACAPGVSAYPRLEPTYQAVVWASLLAAFLYLEWGERRTRRLYFLGAFFAAAIATMGKGPAGAVLPVLALGGYFVVTRRYRLLLDMELAAGTVAFSAMVLPWAVAMVARHGQGFVDRLLFHDIYKRAFEQVHDTNEGEDVSFRYYVWQLGYGTFPWVALLPYAFVRSLAREGSGAREDAPSERALDRQGTIALLAVWFIASFALFSYMRTKFHHYIFPVVPALAMIAGIALDHMIATARDTAQRHARSAVAAVALLGSGLVLLVLRDFAVHRPSQPAEARLLYLFTYQYERPWPKQIDFSTPFWVLGALLAIAMACVAVERIRKHALVAFGALAVVFATFCLDVYFPAAAPHWGQREIALRYVEASQQVPGPLVAYQMNWKGENFYNGNRIATFVETGQPFREWLTKMKKKGEKTFYIVLIPGRARTLESELGPNRELLRLTTPQENNKFALYRVRY